MHLYNSIKKYTNIPPWIRYLLYWFIGSRILLSIIGVIAYKLIVPLNPNYSWHFSDYTILTIWGIWDTGWYIPLAIYGYSKEISSTIEAFGQANYAFFPLLPLFINTLGKYIGYFNAGIIIVNTCLLLGSFSLYQLTRSLYNDQIARQTIKFLYLFPVSFLFSGVLTESLFLFLTITTFYLIHNKSYFLSTITAYTTALTKSVGVTIAISIFTLLIKYRNTYKLLLPIIATLLGLGSFMAYLYALTGDPLAFIHIQNSWGRSLTFPLKPLIGGLFSTDLIKLFNAYFVLFAFLLLFITRKKLPLFLQVYSYIVLLIPLSTGLGSMARYCLGAFPLFIAIALISENKKIDETLTPALAILQGAFMVLWVSGFNLIV